MGRQADAKAVARVHVGRACMACQSLLCVPSLLLVPTPPPPRRGYLCTQVLGGVWADRFGGKVVLGAGVAWWSIATALTPLAAQASRPGRVMRALGRSCWPSGLSCGPAPTRTRAPPATAFSATCLPTTPSPACTKEGCSSPTVDESLLHSHSPPPPLPAPPPLPPRPHCTHWRRRRGWYRCWRRAPSWASARAWRCRR